MTTKAQIAARKQRNLELGQRDAKNRCGVCKIELPLKVLLRWGDPKMYCSQACLDQAAGRHE